MLFAKVITLATALGLASASPKPPIKVEISRRDNALPGKYIVQLKEGASFKGMKDLKISGIQYEWDTVGFKAFTGKFDKATLDRLAASPHVASIEEDGIMSIPDYQVEHKSAKENVNVITQTNAPWGLARLSQDAKLGDQNPAHLNFSYSYGAQAGNGVDIYLLDTGRLSRVYAAHSDFGGRASIGAVFGGYPATDGNGHGTHLACTAIGTRFGVAKAAKLIAVKVLSDQGSGVVSDIIAGINWVVQQVQTTGRPGVILLALGGSASTALDSAVRSAINAGVPTIVPIGSSNTDASSTSPARVQEAIAVGAMAISDAVASFNNWGSLLDLYAPGVSITSCWIGGTASTNTLSGTSAVAHVAGLAAYLRSIVGTTISVETALAQTAVKGVLTGVPAGTLNALASNNVTRLGITL